MTNRELLKAFLQEKATQYLANNIEELLHEFKQNHGEETTTENDNKEEQNDRDTSPADSDNSTTSPEEE